MKQFVFVLIFVVLQVILHIKAQEKYENYVCPKHEVSDPCVNPCQPTCAEPHPPVCNFLVCNKGCVCKPGLLRNQKTNQCIPPHLCPKECGEHEEWTPCGAACIQTCQSLNNPKFCPSSQACTPGCVCRKGYILDEDLQKCIPRKKCLRGINEV